MKTKRSNLIGNESLLFFSDLFHSKFEKLCQSANTYYLKIVSATFLLVCFISLKKSKNVSFLR